MTFRIRSKIPALFICIISFLAIVFTAPAFSADGKMNARVTKSYGKLPLSFVENKGQMDKRARFLIRGPRASAFFRNDGVTFDLWDASKKDRLNKKDMLNKAEPVKAPKPEKRQHAVLKLTFKGADPKCRVEGMDKLPGTTNYMIGNDKSKWHTDVPTYKGVIYKNVWRGIDVIYRGDRNQLKYDIRVNPRADIRKVQLRYDGAQKMWLDKKGTLHIKTAVTEFIEKVPGIYQEKDGKQIPVTGGYRLLDKKTVGFSVKDVDPSLPLVIDPASDLVYSTFLGGTGSQNGWGDTGLGIAVVSSGCAYVTGSTCSTDFPVKLGSYRTSNSGDVDVFIAKLNSSGNDLEYSTYIGGYSFDEGSRIAIDSAGCAYVVGSTSSNDFPTTPGAFDNTNANSDAFIVKLNHSGNALIYSTFLGAGNFKNDRGRDIAIDSSGCAYITGTTDAWTEFPTTPEAFDRTGSGGFVTKLNSTGTELIYSTLINEADPKAIAVDSSGCAYITGTVHHSAFPTTPGAFDTTYNSGVQVGDAFVTKLNALGTGLVYSTFLGGTPKAYSGDDYGEDIAIDSAGCAYVAGSTHCPDFPTTEGAYDRSLGFECDVFVTKFNPSGSGLEYSTFLGGSYYDYGYSIALDSSGCAFISGAPYSQDFPVTPGAYETSYNGDFDLFIAKFNASGSSLEYSTFIGGSGSGRYGHPPSIALDSSNCLYMVGCTESSDFPTTPGAFDTTSNGDHGDVFTMKFFISTHKPDMLIKMGGETSYAGLDIFNTDGTDQTKTQNASVDGTATYSFQVENAGNVDDSFTITGPVDEEGWIVRYYDPNTNDDITSQVTGSGWNSGVLTPGENNGIYATVRPDATVQHGSTRTMLITATSEADDTKIDVVKAVTTSIANRKPDLLIKPGTESIYTGTEIFNTDGSNQTKSMNAAPNQKVTYSFKVKNAGDTNDSFKITAPTGGSGWIVKYYDLSTNAEVTSQ
ncbi:MAG: DUF7948 domain-containing protein, partial [Armatimonadota bacterium]